MKLLYLSLFVSLLMLSGAVSRPGNARNVKQLLCCVQLYLPAVWEALLGAVSLPLGTSEGQKGTHAAGRVVCFCCAELPCVCFIQF